MKSRLSFILLAPTILFSQFSAGAGRPEKEMRMPSRRAIVSVEYLYNSEDESDEPSAYEKAICNEMAESTRGMAPDTPRGIWGDSVKTGNLVRLKWRPVPPANVKAVIRTTNGFLLRDFPKVPPIKIEIPFETRVESSQFDGRAIYRVFLASSAQATLISSYAPYSKPSPAWNLIVDGRNAAAAANWFGANSAAFIPLQGMGKSFIIDFATMALARFEGFDQNGKPIVEGVCTIRAREA